MNRRIRTRLLIIVSLLTVCIYLFAGFPPSVAHMKDRIHLGLDLKGGIELVLQVVTDDAIRAQTDETIEAVRAVLQKENIPVRQIVRKSPDTFLLTGIDPNQESQLRNALAAELASWDSQTSPEGDTYTLKATAAATIREETVDQAMKTIRNRTDQIGVTEPVIQRYGEASSYQMLVQLPGVGDTDRIKEVIQSTALLELKIVDAGPFPSEAAARASYDGPLPRNLELLSMNKNGTTTPETWYVTETSAPITGRDLKTAFTTRDSNGHPAVGFNLTAEGSRRFAQLTEQNIGKRLAIVLDGKVQSAPEIHMRIADSGIIEGGPSGFPVTQAQDLALVLRSGALPASIHYGGEQLIGPTLGAASIRAGIIASAVALGAVSVFMSAYYRMAGVNAIIAMILNIVILLAAIAYFTITLTLPGIAGVTLTIGVGIDSNILIFERIRDELRAGKTAVAAVTTSFSRVFVTLIDTHLAALISAAFLFLFGTGAIKGFAVTLVIGLASNMFTAVFVSRTLFDWTLFRQKGVTRVSI
jgi:preprotein translocase subunit SecD